ncbi:hypothetical protein [Methylobacterium sp.]|uniref:hypothetical protein n=1 Tax=Methylobacterium sp. TaxID=409 RepID=UPI003B5C57BF
MPVPMRRIAVPEILPPTHLPGDGLGTGRRDHRHGAVSGLESDAVAHVVFLGAVTLGAFTLTRLWPQADRRSSLDRDD